MKFVEIRTATTWHIFHESRENVEFTGPSGLPTSEGPVFGEPEVDDPASSLRSLIDVVGGLLGGAGTGAEFTWVKDLLLEAIGTPTVVTANTV